MNASGAERCYRLYLAHRADIGSEVLLTNVSITDHEAYLVIVDKGLRPGSKKHIPSRGAVELASRGIGPVQLVCFTNCWRHCYLLKILEPHRRPTIINPQIEKEPERPASAALTLSRGRCGNMGS